MQARSIAALTLALAGCTPSAPPPAVATATPAQTSTRAPSAADEAWARATDQDLDPRRRIAALDAFVASFPQDPRHRQAAALRAKAEQMTTRHEAQTLASARVHAHAKLSHVTVYHQALRDDPDKFIAHLVFDALETTAPIEPALAQPLVATRIDGMRYRLKRSRWARHDRLLGNLDDESFFAWYIQDCDTRDCADRIVDELSKRLVGRALFRGPSTLDPRALSAGLAKLDALARAAVVGLSADQLYTVFRPTARTYAQVYALMPRKKALAAFRAALKANPEPKDYSYNGGMMEFYSDWAESSGIARAMTRTDLQDELYVITGFWMRRMHDGTDRALARFLTRHVRRFDADWARAHLSRK